VKLELHDFGQARLERDPGCRLGDASWGGFGVDWRGGPYTGGLNDARKSFQHPGARNLGVRSAELVVWIDRARRIKNK
jgi:hypothetical protein